MSLKTYFLISQPFQIDQKMLNKTANLASLKKLNEFYTFVFFQYFTYIGTKSIIELLQVLEKVSLVLS